jgi:hypothetical protein
MIISEAETIFNHTKSKVMKKKIDIILTILGVLCLVMFFVAYMTDSTPLMLGTMSILPMVYLIGNLQ